MTIDPDDLDDELDDELDYKPDIEELTYVDGWSPSPLPRAPSITELYWDEMGETYWECDAENNLNDIGGFESNWEAMCSWRTANGYDKADFHPDYLKEPYDTDPHEELSLVAGWIPVTEDMGGADCLYLYWHDESDTFWTWDNWSGDWSDIGYFDTFEEAKSAWCNDYSIPDLDNLDQIDEDELGENDPPNGFEYLSERGLWVRTSAIVDCGLIECFDGETSLLRVETSYYRGQVGSLDCAHYFGEFDSESELREKNTVWVREEREAAAAKAAVTAAEAVMAERAAAITAAAAKSDRATADAAASVAKDAAAIAAAGAAAEPATPEYLNLPTTTGPSQLLSPIKLAQSFVLYPKPKPTILEKVGAVVLGYENIVVLCSRLEEGVVMVDRIYCEKLDRDRDKDNIWETWLQPRESVDRWVVAGGSWWDFLQSEGSIRVSEMAPVEELLDDELDRRGDPQKLVEPFDLGLLRFRREDKDNPHIRSTVRRLAGLTDRGHHWVPRGNFHKPVLMQPHRRIDATGIPVREWWGDLPVALTLAATG